MGCDIHAMIERIEFNAYPEEGQRPVWEGWWENAGDPNIIRYYKIFAILGNVRNPYGIPFIAEQRGIPEDATEEYECWARHCGGHSHSWVTLAELKAYDVNQTYFDPRYLVRNAEGEITHLREGGSTPEASEQAGERTIFEIWGSTDWDRLIATVEAARKPYRTDDEVRICFWFDN